jgi:hypothetical protein
VRIARTLLDVPWGRGGAKGTFIRPHGSAAVAGADSEKR